MASIRRAKLTDLPFIVTLSSDSFSPYGHYDLSIAKWFLTPGTHTFVCEKENRDKKLSGFVMLALMKDKQDEKTALEIIAIAVSKDCRRQGIGTELIDFVKHFNEEMAGCGKPPKIRLSVAETNTSGRSFFEKCGFRVIAEAPWRYPAGQKALRMEL